MQRPKPRFDSQHHQPQYRHAHPNYGGGVPQQGPPPNVGQARMPNAAASMRAQGMNVRPSHVPQQQQQQQQLQNQQVQQQQAHAGVVQHHQGYPQVSAQGHHTPHTMYYQHNHHGVPQSFIQISPYPVSVTPNPGMPLHPLTQTQAYIPRYTAYTFPTGNNQQPTAAYFQAAATPHTQQMYTAAVAPHFVQQQHRMATAAMHNPGQAVANAQQLQQAPVAPSHPGVVTGISAAQHQSQHSHPHPQQTGVPVVPQQPQQIPRQEQQQGQERKRKILKIVDPKTGEDVLNSSNSAVSSENSNQSSESGSTTKGASSNDTAQSVVPTTVEKQDSQSQSSQPAQESQDSKQKDETVTSTKPDEGANAAANDSKKAVRAEFFQKIAQASDDTRSSSTASTGSSSANTTSSTNNTSSNNNAQPSAETPQPEEPVAVAASTPVPSTPTKEKSPSPEPNKQLVATPAANTSSDDSKDASLVSISPTPMDHYATPRSKEPVSSPPLQPPIEKYAEEEVIEDKEPSEDGAVSEEIIEPEVTEPARQTDVEEISDSVQESEVRADSELSGSVKQEELEKDEEMEVDEPEVIQENQPNGHVPLEEGEIEEDGDDGEDESLLADADASADDQEDLTGSVKGKIKYDRDFLLRIGNRPEGINEFKVADHGLPDLARDNNLANHIKPHGTPIGKNSPGGRDYRGSRGMPGLGNKPLMQHQNMQHIRAMGGMGLGNWGMVVPPPPPGRVQPKVQLTLTRDEVKLHKAENAWKPGKLKRGGPPGADQAADEESIAIESIVKQTRGILNKLTPDNFEKLVSKFMELPLEDKDERISSVISVVFEKAIDEPSFSTAYAKMVFTVCKQSQETSKKFRKQILDQCQKEFQKSSADEADIKEVEQKLAEATDEGDREQLKVDLEEKKFMNRRRSLGNVRFIGELYKLQMLTPKIMVECVHLLLYAPDEEKLECLCKLLTTVGQKLDLQLKALEDFHARGGDKPKFVPEPKWMSKIFSQLKDLSDNKKFSSRIRFAILDVVELRENDWKPRRDTNAPKTIQEVRNDAMRQEQEEKRQINSLPPVQNNTYGGGGDRDHRSSNSRMPGSLQQKKTEWTSTPKASRFQTGVKKAEPIGTGLPVFGPPSGSGFSWQRNQSGASGSSQMKPQPNMPPNLPPRLQNRFQNLAMEDNRPSNKGMSNSSQDSGGYRDRDHMPPMFASHGGPPSLHTPTSPPPSMSSSAENSRPVSPKDNPEVTADTNESVKNIFQEYLASKKFDDTLHWIKGRFPGPKIDDFIEEISRQVAEMSKEVEQKCAGSLVRLLIRFKEIKRDSVIRLMAQGVMDELPDILIDSPMATQYLAQFLVEIFSEETNLDWLVQVGNKLIQNEDDEGAAWRDLAVNSLNLLKLRNNEENVQTSYKKTERKNVIPVEEIPWLQERTPDSLAEQMVKVLSPKVSSETSDEIGQIFQEHSWDVREEITARALTEAICRLTWNPDAGSWEDEIVKKLLPLLDLPNPKMFPVVWRQVEEYSKKQSIKKEKSEGLWNIMYSLNMTTTGSD